MLLLAQSNGDIRNFSKEEALFKKTISSQARLLSLYALIAIHACSNTQARPCSNTAIHTTMKRHVARNVATPKHHQHPQKCLRHNHQSEKHNQTQ
jgi:hypothetical protein